MNINIIAVCMTLFCVLHASGAGSFNRNPLWVGHVDPAVPQESQSVRERDLDTRPQLGDPTRHETRKIREHVGNTIVYDDGSQETPANE